MDIPAEHEADFNRVYDTEHAKYLCQAPGVHSCDRFLLKSTDAPKFARYAAVYGIDDPSVPSSEGWRIEGEKGDWATKIRPHTTNRTHTILKRIADSATPRSRRGTSTSCRPISPPMPRTNSTICTTPCTLPGLCQVDGVASATRYRVESTNLNGLQKYAAVYHIAGPAVGRVRRLEGRRAG